MIEGSHLKYFRVDPLYVSTKSSMPVTFVDVVLGKFLAAVVFAAAMLIPTFAFPITVSFLGDLEMCRLRSQKEVSVQNRLYIVARNRL